MPGQDLPTQADIRRFPVWHQRIEFPNGITVGAHPADMLIRELTSRYAVAGKTCLDIGCCNGVMCRDLELAGAALVTGIDIEDHFVRQCIELIRPAFGLTRTSFFLKSVYDIHPSCDLADFVVFCGVYYHLKHPLLGLEKAWSCCREVMMVEGAIFPGPLSTMTFVIGEHDGDPTNWWYPTIPCMNDMIQSLGNVRSVKLLQPPYNGPNRCIWLVEKEQQG